jgi:hypothetical protein
MSHAEMKLNGCAGEELSALLQASRRSAIKNERDTIGKKFLLISAL